MLSSIPVIFLSNVDDCLDFEYSSDVLRLFIHSASASPCGGKHYGGWTLFDVHE